MHHRIFGQYLAVLVPLILLSVLAFYFLHKKKSIVRRNGKDADTGASNSSTTPIETNSDAPGTLTTSIETNYGSSSLSAASTTDCYEVFLSFSGSDTRKGFTDHLYHGLCDAGIYVFRDDSQLCDGEQINRGLSVAIMSSKILIPILSKNYGSSGQCLDELVQMMECKKNNKQQLVLPIYYKVKQDHVKCLIGNFGDAFRTCEKRFDGSTLKKWKQALSEVSSLKGFEVKGYEGALVKLVIQKVLSELKKWFELDTPPNLVGIDSHMKVIMKFVEDNRSATLFVGIHGMGGIGKTTLAKTIYNKLSKQFQYRGFIADIRAHKHHGLENLQKQLISDVLKQENQVYDKDEETKSILSIFQDKKVLILLDDVDNDNQLKALAGNHSWFSLGSKIIITTRNKAILNDAKVDYNYELTEMDRDQSLILFSRHAFQRDVPPREFADLTYEVVSITGGLPLALQIIGSTLYKEKSRKWEQVINNLKKVPAEPVQRALRTSYDALQDEHKQIFLDIACFFIGIDKRITSYMWDACGFSPQQGIQVLISLSLIKVGDNDELIMHDQLRDLGREIVGEEDKLPQHRSRLWNSKEVLEVLNRNEGTGKIKAIYLSGSSSEGSSKSAYQVPDIHADHQFKNLTNLRFLHVSGVHFRGDFKNSFENLRWLQWRNCPLTFEANNFHVKELIVLDLSRSKISDKWQGWSSIMVAKKLKFLDFTRCRSLKGTFFLSAFKNLEVLILRDCKEVEQIDSSIGEMKSLEILNISGTGIKELPNNIGRLGNLRDLDASRCKKLRGKMPQSIFNLFSLQRLDFYNCRELRSLPKLPSSLTYLRVTCQKLPSLSNLTHLKELRLIACKFVKCIPELPSSLSKPSECSQLTDIVESELLESLNTPFKLEILEISCCDFMETLDVSQLNHLRTLSVEYCDKIVEVRGLDRLKYLESLTVKGCDSIERLDLSKSKSLKLYVQDCKNLVPIQGLNR